jgi:hypothetical protein
MSLKVNWFITDQNVTVNYKGQTHIVKRSDALADQLIRAIKEGRFEEVPNLVSVAKEMEHKSKGNVVVRDGELLVKGVKVPPQLAKKIQSFIKEGLPYQPLVKFAENLQGNPSYRSVNELFQFLEKNDHPFTENGNFIAYKKVREDFKDVHSGTFDNTPGVVVEVPRNQVDEDSSRTCSNGLHVANYGYASDFYAGGVMLEVEVNPADVVAIPADYNQSKMRVCRYKVLGVVEAEVTGSSLRVTDPCYIVPNENEDMGEEECDYCDAPVDCAGCHSCSLDCLCKDDTGVCESCGDDCELGDELCEGCCDKEVFPVPPQGRPDFYPFEDEFEDE